MSGAKETPRQKLIGLMYLVLMAMLAMNVSKDVLDAFITINGSLIENQKNSSIQNNMLFNDIQGAYALDAKKTKVQMEKATEIRTQSAEMLAYLKLLKNEVISTTEEITMDQADTIHMDYLSNKDNYDIPTNLMVGMVEDGSEGKSKELHQKIDTYKKAIESLFNEKDLKTLKLGLKLEGGIQDGIELNWEVKTFDRTPLVATVAILSKLEMDVMNAEHSALNKLYASIGKDDFPFDTIAAKVVAPTSYILLGDEYNAEVFLAAFSTTQKPKMTLNEEGLEVINGVGNYTLKTNKEGIFEYNGSIDVMKKNGEVKAYPFESNYIVAKPSLTVSPIKMNVLYIGIDNPISISVPGIANTKINARSSHGSLKPAGNGTYNINPPKRGAPRKVNISVSANMKDGSSKSMGTMEFRLKRIPNPKIKILNKTGNLVFSKVEVGRMNVVRAVYGEDFLFDGKANVVSCTMETTIKNKPIKTDFRNGKLSAKAKSILQKVTPGTLVRFTKITVKGMDGSTVQVDPVTIKIK